MVVSFALAFSLLSTAQAGPCDAALKKAESTKGEAIGGAFRDLAKCDKALAEANYTKVMSNATDTDALVSLTRAAVEAEVWSPVWAQLSKISDYSARDEVARRVGEACGESPATVRFLQGAYFGLRDIEFQQWDDAFINCGDAGLTTWLTGQVEAPPARQFDEKFNALLDIYVKKQRGAALPALTKGAIKAAKDGPYDAILMQMDAAVAPELGANLSAEDQAKLEAALVEVARAVDPSRARAVADRLANAGSQQAAARLLPTVYPDRVQDAGGFLYGAAAIEAGDCKGKKQAILHVAEVREAGRRWVILTDTEAALKDLKPKLKGCTVESPWPVAATPEPVKSAKDIEAWVATLEKAWADKGYEVKVQAEKGVSLN